MLNVPWWATFEVTIDQILRTALDQVSRPAASAELETGIPGTFRVQGSDGIYGGPGTTASGPGPGRDSHDRVAEAARIYRAAVLSGRPPVQAVEREMHVSRSTAGRMVGIARKAGLISPTTQGRVSDVPEED